MAFIALNGDVIKTPASCTWGLSDESSEESGRSTQDGLMHKDVVAQKRTLKIKWGRCSWMDAMKIARYCKAKGVQIMVTYPDIMAGGMLTKAFYTGDLTVPYDVWYGQVTKVESVSCDFIEM